jgi:hypothetical protein
VFGIFYEFFGSFYEFFGVEKKHERAKKGEGTKARKHEGLFRSTCILSRGMAQYRWFFLFNISKNFLDT